MLRAFAALILTVLMATALPAQEAAPAPDRASTGGAPTLEDILARQRGEQVDFTHRLDSTGTAAAGIAEQLGTLGGASNSDVFLKLR